MESKAEGVGRNASIGGFEQVFLSSAETLAARIAALRTQVRAIVVQDASPSVDDVRDSERITALELLLAQTREREDRLAIEMIHNAAALAELEKDIEALTDEIAVAATGTSRTERLTKERDEARERASVERQLAAQDRERAEEAEQRVLQLKEELEEALGRLATVRELKIETKRPSPRVLETVGSPTPWVELQHLASESDPGGGPVPSDARGATEIGEIVDLTAPETVAVPEGAVTASADTTGDAGAPTGRVGGPFRRLWRRRQAPDLGPIA
jgi:hypothetical protein